MVQNTFHDACGRNSNNDGDDAIANIFCNRDSGGRQIYKMTNVQSVESNNMADSCVRDIHLSPTLKDQAFERAKIKGFPGRAP